MNSISQDQIPSLWKSKTSKASEVELVAPKLGTAFAYMSAGGKMNAKGKFRNTQFVVEQSQSNYQKAISKGLMQATIIERQGKKIILSDGRRAVEFINCSYLGLDLHPKVQEAYRNVGEHWGVNFCCARSRFSIEPLQVLENRLGHWLKGHAVTFPSVTATHMAVMPLVASGLLLDTKAKVTMIFDKLAHSSMQYLKPILAQESDVVTIGHNDLESLVGEVKRAKLAGRVPVFVADGIYSMGGIAPIHELLGMAEQLDFYVYIDDAHGTSIFGERGEGPILSQIAGDMPDRMILTFALSKGFGTNGGGVVFPHKWQENALRTYGQIYAFSAALDFAPTLASLASLDLHLDGTILPLQKKLTNNIQLFDSLNSTETAPSPIRMIRIGDSNKAIAACNELLNLGYFTSVVFFPIVARNNAQLRISVSANHTQTDIVGLSTALNVVLNKVGIYENETVAI